jgi:putative membrane protein
MTGGDAGRSDPSEIWDRGVQNERTSLAWTRSILSCFGCALLLARLAANTSWIIGAVIALAALALALAAVRVSARRYRQAASALSVDEPLPDGTLPAIIVALVLLIGGAAVVFILVEL